MWQQGAGERGRGVLLPLTCLSWCKFAQFVALSLCLLWYLRALWRAQAAAREAGTGGGGAYLIWGGTEHTSKVSAKLCPSTLLLLLPSLPLSLSFARLLCTFACRFCIFKILLHLLQRTFATAVVVVRFCWVFFGVFLLFHFFFIISFAGNRNLIANYLCKIFWFHLNGTKRQQITLISFQKSISLALSVPFSLCSAAPSLFLALQLAFVLGTLLPFRLPLSHTHTQSHGYICISLRNCCCCCCSLDGQHKLTFSFAL